MEIDKAIAIVASAITIVYALPYVIKFIQFLGNSLFRKEFLTGIWHAYHFTRLHGKILLRHERWTIKRNILNRLIIRTQDLKNRDLKYKGVILVQRNYLLISLKGIKHKEVVQMRFFDIIPTGQDVIFGLVMGIDFDNKPQCFVRFMGRREFADEEARKLLLFKTTVKDNAILSISEQDIE